MPEKKYGRPRVWPKDGNYTANDCIAWLMSTIDPPASRKKPKKPKKKRKKQTERQRRLKQNAYARAYMARTKEERRRNTVADRYKQPVPEAERDELYTRIVAALAVSGESRSLFGTLAAGDPALIRRIECGRQIKSAARREKIEERCAYLIDGGPPGQPVSPLRMEN